MYSGNIENYGKGRSNLMDSYKIVITDYYYEDQEEERKSLGMQSWGKMWRSWI